MNRPRDLLIVIPASNESDRISGVVDGILKTRIDADVLVVEDSSTDQTVATAKAAGARVVSLPFSLGYGGAIRVGLTYARSKGYQYVITMDADGQHDPEDLPSVLEPLRSNHADLVIGSRFLGGATYRIPLPRRIGMCLFSAITTLVVGHRISDTTSGYTGLGPRALSVAAAHCATDFPNAELICMVAKAGLAVTEVPVTIHERTDGKSLFTFWRAVYYPFKLLLAISMVVIRK